MISEADDVPTNANDRRERSVGRHFRRLPWAVRSPASRVFGHTHAPRQPASTIPVSSAKRVSPATE